MAVSIIWGSFSLCSCNKSPAIWGLTRAFDLLETFISLASFLYLDGSTMRLPISELG